MNTRSLEQFQRLLTQSTDSEEEPAEGSLLWAATQLRRIARMLEDMQTASRQAGDAMPPVPEAFPAAGPSPTGQRADDTAHPPPLPGGRPSAARPVA